MITELSAALILACSAGIYGLVGAIYWFRASRVSVNIEKARLAFLGDKPIEGPDHGPVAVMAIHLAAQEASRLNAIAAIWTALATIFGAISAVVGNWH